MARYTDPIDHLQQVMQNRMMDCGDVCDAVDFASEAFDIEREHGHEFTKAELMQIWHHATEYVIDAYISNEHDTPNSSRHCWDGETPDQQREKAIARWEAMRPSTRRIAKLTQLMMF